jgi:hypothetical protein
MPSIDNKKEIQDYLRKKKEDEERRNLNKGAGPLSNDEYYGPGFIDPEAFGADVPAAEEPSEEGDYSIAAVDEDKSYDMNKNKINQMMLDLANIKASPVDMSKYEQRLKDAEAKLEASRKREDWAEAASQIAGDLAKLGAALYNQKTGYNVAGLDINKYSGKEGRDFAERQYEREAGKVEKDIAKEERESEKDVARKIDVSKIKLSILSDDLNREHQKKIEEIRNNQKLAKETAAEQKAAKKIADAEVKALNKLTKEAFADVASAKLLEGEQATTKLTSGYNKLLQAGYSEEQLKPLFMEEGWFSDSAKDPQDVDVSTLTPPAVAQEQSAELERVMPDGKTAIFDGNTKKFIRWK